MEKGFGFPEQKERIEKPKIYNEFLENYLKNLKLPAQESEGFLLIPSEKIKSAAGNIARRAFYFFKVI